MSDLFRLTRRFTTLFLLIFILASCKSKKIISEGTLDTKMSSKALIKAHYQNELDYKTLSGKIKIEYSDGKATQSVGVSLRMKKGEAIWLSAPLGIVKVYITPERVSFYNKLENTYFDGDFSYLTKLLGTELDFEKLERLLLGEALFDLRDTRYDLTVLGDNYSLKPKKPIEHLKILFELEPQNFKMASQQLSQPMRQRLLEINYKNYQKIDKWILPNEILILAIDRDQRNKIDLEYRNMEFDRTLNFPYKIPKGFDEIVLSKNDI